MAKRIKPPLILPAVTAFMAIAVAILAQRINSLNADVRSQATSATPTPCSINLSKTITPQDRCTTTTYKQAIVICQNDKRTTINQSSCATTDQFKTLGDKYCQTMSICKK